MKVDPRTTGSNDIINEDNLNNELAGTTNNNYGQSGYN